MKIMIYSIIMLFMSSSCDCERITGVSKDIEYSIKIGVFVKEFEVKNEYIQINDTLGLHVKEAWIENMWTHECYSNVKLFKDFRGNNYQLCINSSEEDLQRYAFDWEIGNSFLESFRSTSKSSIVMDLKISELKSWCIDVYLGEITTDSSKNIVIGEFCLGELKRQ